jgi:hypothetical protein
LVHVRKIIDKNYYANGKHKKILLIIMFFLKEVATPIIRSAIILSFRCTFPILCGLSEETTLVVYLSQDKYFKNYKQLCMGPFK